MHSRTPKAHHHSRRTPPDTHHQAHGGAARARALARARPALPRTSCEAVARVRTRARRAVAGQDVLAELRDSLAAHRPSGHTRRTRDAGRRAGPAPRGPPPPGPDRGARRPCQKAGRSPVEDYKSQKAARPPVEDHKSQKAARPGTEERPRAGAAGRGSPGAARSRQGSLSAGGRCFG
ncbi:Hypothetical predicted protein [Marmota monax]|uniref:Uncharacterized protein n=1 Tax=Marmota monax TaxID=9995 RepID=A0A5E4CJX5_MARMO|nr:hypothetical protein GHT09_012036 [Marmota monax]VTJ82088.1 Hypothetical predicted protein [Marmota monax]